MPNDVDTFRATAAALTTANTTALSVHPRLEVVAQRVERLRRGILALQATLRPSHLKVAEHALRDALELVKKYGPIIQNVYAAAQVVENAIATEQRNTANVLSGLGGNLGPPPNKPLPPLPIDGPPPPQDIPPEPNVGPKLKMKPLGVGFQKLERDVDEGDKKKVMIDGEEVEVHKKKWVVNPKGEAVPGDNDQSTQYLDEKARAKYRVEVEKTRVQDVRSRARKGQDVSSQRGQRNVKLGVSGGDSTTFKNQEVKEKTPGGHKVKLLKNEFVMDDKGQMFMGSTVKSVTDREGGDLGERNDLHHASFLAGGDVSGAGEVYTDKDGIVKELSNQSGHYRPGEDQQVQAIETLEGMGVNMDNVRLKNLSEQGTSEGMVREYMQGGTEDLPTTDGGEQKHGISKNEQFKRRHDVIDEMKGKKTSGARVFEMRRKMAEAEAEALEKRTEITAPIEKERSRAILEAKAEHEARVKRIKGDKEMEELDEDQKLELLEIEAELKRKVQEANARAEEELAQKKVELAQIELEREDTLLEARQDEGKKRREIEVEAIRARAKEAETKIEAILRTKDRKEAKKKRDEIERLAGQKAEKELRVKEIAEAQKKAEKKREEILKRREDELSGKALEDHKRSLELMKNDPDSNVGFKLMAREHTQSEIDRLTMTDEQRLEREKAFDKELEDAEAAAEQELAGIRVDEARALEIEKERVETIARVKEESEKLLRETKVSKEEKARLLKQKDVEVELTERKAEELERVLTLKLKQMKKLQAKHEAKMLEIEGLLETDPTQYVALSKAQESKFEKARAEIEEQARVARTKLIKDFNDAVAKLGKGEDVDPNLESVELGEVDYDDTVAVSPRDDLGGGAYEPSEKEEPYKKEDPYKTEGAYKSESDPYKTEDPYKKEDPYKTEGAYKTENDPYKTEDPYKKEDPYKIEGTYKTENDPYKTEDPYKKEDPYRIEGTDKTENDSYKTEDPSKIEGVYKTEESTDTTE